MNTAPLPILSELSERERAALLARLPGLYDQSGGPDACWPYTGGSLTSGYPVQQAGGWDTRRRVVKLHRVIFEDANDGASPPVVDHACHDTSECKGGDTCPHRKCGNPRHLAPSDRGRNVSRARKGFFREECRAGHRMDEDNTYTVPTTGARQCKACSRIAAETRAERARRARASTGPLAVAAAPEPARLYRPRGMSMEQVVDWVLDHAEEVNGCLYAAGHEPGTGYHTVAVGGATLSTYRLVYQVMSGPIPDGYDVDHTCHDPKVCRLGDLCPHRGCICPDHLEAVPHAENSGAGRAAHRQPKECKRGHAFTEGNTYVDKRGSRLCKACMADSQRARRAAAPAKDDGRARKGGMCKNGLHVIADVGVTSVGKCLECTRAVGREAARRRRARAAQPGTGGVVSA